MAARAALRRRPREPAPPGRPPEDGAAEAKRRLDAARARLQQEIAPPEDEPGR